MCGWYDFAQRFPRLFAGLWFTGAALMGMMICTGICEQGMMTTLLSGYPELLLTPLLATCITGMTWGYRIISRPMPGAWAIGAGAATGCIAYILFMLMEIVLFSIATGDIALSITHGIIIFSPVMLLLCIPIMLAGGTAGWLLHRFACTAAQHEKSAIIQ